MAAFSKLSVEYQVQRTALNVTPLTPLIWIFLRERFCDSIGEGFVYYFLLQNIHFFDGAGILIGLFLFNLF